MAARSTAVKVYRCPECGHVEVLGPISPIYCVVCTHKGKKVEME